MVAPCITVYSRAGLVEIPLTGDPAFDALLERVARRGGAVERERVVTPQLMDPDQEMRAALRAGA